MPLMRADTQFAVVEATLKGYNKWVLAHGKMPQQDVCIPRFSRYYLANQTQEQKRSELESALETWALSLMQRNYDVRLSHMVAN